MEKKAEFNVNIGLSSILLIFVVLCLVSFGILSLVSANADRKLSKKVLNRTSAYYEACNQAESTLCSIDKTLHTLYEACDSAEAYYEQAGGTTLSFQYDISELQALQITLNILYPETDHDAFYQITSWKVITTQELDYDEQLHVIP